MSTCKECFHYAVCAAKGKHANYQVKNGKQYLVAFENPVNCKHFKDRSKFIELPCKVNIGDKVWTLDLKDTICTGTVVCIFKDVLGFSIDIGWEICELKNVGKTVFFTKEEAEQALKECGKK